MHRPWERAHAPDREIAARIAAGESGIAGLMLESFLVPGRQEPGPLATLDYGRSVTDACVGWPETADLLRELAAAVREGRAARGAQAGRTG